MPNFPPPLSIRERLRRMASIDTPSICSSSSWLHFPWSSMRLPICCFVVSHAFVSRPLMASRASRRAVFLAMFSVRTTWSACSFVSFPSACISVMTVSCRRYHSSTLAMMASDSVLASCSSFRRACFSSASACRSAFSSALVGGISMVFLRFFSRSI